MFAGGPDASSNPVFQYMTGQRNHEQGPLLEAFARESEAATAALGPRLDIPYGPHPRQRFDLFAAAAPRATLAYFHAGYWQSRDKAQFRFLAPTLTGAGFDLALVNYPLCPDVALDALTEAAREFILAFHVDRGERAAPLIVAGHSAGAHLAVELALTDWRARGVAFAPIHGIVALSGVYDLAPLIETPLNDNLRLTPDAARAASPLGRVRAGAPRAIFAVGGKETPAFHAQTEAMRAAWEASGAVARSLIVAGADHFSLLRELMNSDSPLLTAIDVCLDAEAAIARTPI
jgi:arylformamidase